MASRGVWQLQKLVVHYCKASGDSAGARSFIKDVLPGFASAHPWLPIEVYCRHGKAPTLTAAYADGTHKTVDVKGKPTDSILDTAQQLRDSTTATVRSLAKPVITSRPSVQGVWGPDLSYSDFSLREGTALR